MSGVAAAQWASRSPRNSGAGSSDAAAVTALGPWRLGDDLARQVLLDPHPGDRVELALEPVGVLLLVAHHLLEDGRRPVVTEVVALLRRGVELRAETSSCS